MNGERDKSRILVIGSGGRLGRALMRSLEHDFEVTGVDRAAMDLRNNTVIESILNARDFECVLVPAALTAVDYCEENHEEAYAINAEAPGEIARVCGERKAKVIYFSTDFVFDGRKSEPYVEEDTPAPLGVYGASKLEGERRVLEASPGNLVLRLAWVFGPDRPGFPEWIMEQAKQREDLRLPGDKIGSPSFTRDVAEWTKPFLPGGHASGHGGVCHLSNSGTCSWVDWGRACLRAASDCGAGIKTTEIAAGLLADVDAFVAERPRMSALANGKFERLSGVRPRSWEEAVRLHFEETLGKGASSV